MTQRIRIRGGRLIDPRSETDRIADVFVSEGRVVGLDARPDWFVADLEVAASGQIVCPGFIDLSARLREPGQEHKATIAGESRAAAAAGITTLCCPPDTIPVIDNPAVAKLIREKSYLHGKVRIIPFGALTRGLEGRDLSEMSALKEAGCIAVSNAEFPVANTLILRRAMEYAASHGLTVVIRPEDFHLADLGCVHEGPVATRMGLPGIPYAAETVAIAQVLALIEPTGAKVHFAQLSSGQSLRGIAKAQSQGLPVSADVAAHQLHLTESDVLGFDSRCHVRPPLRSPADREALREAVRDGLIESICSAHQPHEPDAKLNAFAATEPGMAALETLLPLTLRLVDEGVLDLPAVIARLTTGPAAALGLDLGGIRVGAIADICVFDPDERWIPNETTWLSSGRNTPFWGQPMKGRVTHTLWAGRLAFGTGDTAGKT
jgi:dihydroorotase